MGKREDLYRKVAKGLDAIARDDSVERFDALMDRGHRLFLDGFNPDYMPSSEYGAETVMIWLEYCDSLRNRKKVEIEGAEREMATEPEAFRGLNLAHSLAQRFRPVLSRKTSFSDKLFSDIYNLSFAYLDAVVGGVSDEYIDADSAFDEKTVAVDLARQGARVKGIYKTDDGLGNGMHRCLKRFRDKLADVSGKNMRPFGLVATSRKKVGRKTKVTNKVVNDVTKRGEDGSFEFCPRMIIPIAHGGGELGVAMANAFEDQGHDAVVYPLMFSMKTRKQKRPWVDNDSRFLSLPFEGSDILIAEDWVTTGNTVRGILTRLEDRFPREIRIATWKRDIEKSRIPLLDKYDFYVGEWSVYKGEKTDSLADQRR